MKVSEIGSMDPFKYKQYFRSLYWSGTKNIEKKVKNKGLKKEKYRKTKGSKDLSASSALTILYNPSQFAVFAAVRRAILTRWKHFNSINSEYSDDSDGEDATTSQLLVAKLPKITSIGLRTVFALVSQARFTDSDFCEHALRALLDVLQGHVPEELCNEPSEIIANLHAMLVEVASGSGPSGRVDNPTNLTALSSSCLMALSVARGEAELILNTVASLIMAHPMLEEQHVQIPKNVTVLQRSVQSIILGPSARTIWLNTGVPNQALVMSFPVDLPSCISGHGELIVRSLASDGCFIYVYTSKGLFKIGSGYGSSLRQHVYAYKQDFFPTDRHGWIGCCGKKLYLRIGRKKTEVYEIDKETLDVTNVIRLEVGEPEPVEAKSALFTDGTQLGLIVLSSHYHLTVKFYDIDPLSERTAEAHTLTANKEVKVRLHRRRIMVLGRAPFEDNNIGRRAVDLDAPLALQLEDLDEDPLMSIVAGQEFGIMTTLSGKVYYTGKASSLGYKSLQFTQSGKWNLMKEPVFNMYDYGPNGKRLRIVQVAIGHEGVHAIIVMDNWTALFMGVARRGEDGDNQKNKRTPKPTKPKKMLKTEGHSIVQAACNYGSTALVTRDGLLLMFGKDTQYCDADGVVTGLKHERILEVALGKAHAVALTSNGQVYTFGINNKGQCGREFGYTKERSTSLCRRARSKERERERERERELEQKLCAPGKHAFRTEYCRVCAFCRQCTGFGTACQCSKFPDRVPREKCGCGEGDAGCSACGSCRRCASSLAATSAARPDPNNEEIDPSSADNSNADNLIADCQGNAEYTHYEERDRPASPERDAGLKVSCLPPGRVAVPGGHKIVALATGLHHTVLLTDSGEVLTFGSNQHGQLGAGDIAAHHRLIRVRVPRTTAVAAGSNHTVVLTREGEVYTFGSYQKGALGRPRIDEPPSRTDRSPIWYATPGRVPRVGPSYGCEAIWVTACGDQTYFQVSQAIIKTDSLFSSTVTANQSCIMILPNQPEHAFKCITLNKVDGSCENFTGPEQVDFVNSLASIDPLYDILWCYHPQMRLMKCYNIMAFDSQKLRRCCGDFDPTLYAADGDMDYPNYGSMRRIEDFKNLEYVEAVCQPEERQLDLIGLMNTTIMSQELAIPCVPDCTVTRMHAALHLLGCLDSLTYAHDNKLSSVESKRESAVSPVVGTKEDFLTVNRFENHGGGWGYSGFSVEAIRFMCDTDILLGGYGLYGGRGDYTAKIKLYDIGPEGGEQEGDGELIADTEEVLFECAPRDKFPVLFEAPVPLVANRWYVAWACLSGPSSDCGSAGQAMVVNDDVVFYFKTSKKSNNGTDLNAGQIPCLLYNVLSPDHIAPLRKYDPIEPIVPITKNISRKVTVACFRALITLLQWSWSKFKAVVLETNGHRPINFQKLTVMKHQKRLVFVIRSCLRLVKSYINEVYPQNHKKRNSAEYMGYFEAIADVRNLIQTILSDPAPTCAMLPKRSGKNKSSRVCYVAFALDMTNSIWTECHDTITSCFHAFFPTPTLKWNHLCSLLFNVKNGVVPPNQIRELTAACVAMCASRSLRDVLQFVVPLTQRSVQAEGKKERAPKSEVPAKSATVPRSSHTQKPPPVPPRAGSKESAPKAQDQAESKPNYMEWHLIDSLQRILDILMTPMKQQMMTRTCGQPHDHGEIKQNERLAKYCSKLTARIVSELVHGVSNIKDDIEANRTVRVMSTPSRFMRVNQSRTWNTGNGSPDAICFTVDRPGIWLVGVYVFGGIGSFEYELELLQDMRQLHPQGGDNSSNCWVSVAVTNGTYSYETCQHDVARIKFEKPVSLKEELRYAIRLCNHGGKTVNGDCGMPSVKGPDGTTFRFSSCSLSFNGTSLARGQIPCLCYFGTPRPTTFATENTDSMLVDLRSIALRVTSKVMERTADLFCNLRNELTAEDLRRNALVLQRSPVVNILVPYTLAAWEGLNDLRSMVQVLEMIHMVLPHVAAVNLIVPGPEDNVGSLPNTTGHYYTWVESDHPYKQASVNNIRVMFPPNVSCIVLEMDPRSITAQPEDSLTIYAVTAAPKQRCQKTSSHEILRQPFKKRYVQLTTELIDGDEVCEESGDETPCLHYNCTYIAVTPKMAHQASDWPQKAILVPGNEVIFSLETASDYMNEYKDENDEGRYGFRCLCVGYEDAPFASQRHGLAVLEMELVYAGASCASRLLDPDLDIPPLSPLTVKEVHTCPLNTYSPSTGALAEVKMDECEALLLAKGLEIPSPINLHQILDGQILLRYVSNVHQFLVDFVLASESTAGGRLADWLAPASRVDPTKCELRAPGVQVRPAVKLTLPIVLRDQYGDLVCAPALRVEVLVYVSHDHCPLTKGRHNSAMPAIHHSDHPYEITTRDTMRFHAVTMMKSYQGYSFEELRLAYNSWRDALADNAGCDATHDMSPERLPVRTLADGTYAADWTPRGPGTYCLRCSLDEAIVPKDLTINVAVATSAPLSERCATPAPPAKQRRFVARYSSGLRVRVSPSLQAEEIGRVPPRGLIGIVEELDNKDGTWVRLSAESMRLYAETGATVAWCLQYHKQLEKGLLVPGSPSDKCDDYDITGPSTSKDDASSWPLEGSEDKGKHEASGSKETVYSFFPCYDPLEGDIGDGFFAPEPSKRDRHERNKSQSPARRLQRRSNGNGGSDEWWASDRDISAENNPFLEDDRSRRLAQACTQTSPDDQDEDVTTMFAQDVKPSTSEDGKISPRTIARERLERRSRAYKRLSSPPPVPARTAALPPKKRALSPMQAECLRAIFAAMMWHEGIVDDAIACAAFLKFHPQLPKQGARVVTRATHEILPRPQRHSVEVSSAGHYLNIQPSTLESLTRSGTEALTSRARKMTTDTPLPISEEDNISDVVVETNTPSVVSVLPPALRGFVALWDALTESEQLGAIINAHAKEVTDKKEDEPDAKVPTSYSHKVIWRTPASSRAPISMKCEMCCGHKVPPPLTYHMRRLHPGCGGPTVRGYDRGGVYRRAEALCASSSTRLVCGELAQAYHQWYIICEKCRERCIKEQSIARNRPRPPDINYERVETKPDIDHYTLRHNAVFLLDLEPLFNSESTTSQWSEESGRSPPTPPGSLWQPAPPLQCLAALGVAPRTAGPGYAYHSLGRPAPLPASSVGVYGPGPALQSVSHTPRVHRSVSMDQANGRALAHAAMPPRNETIMQIDPNESLSGGGSSLLAQPSSALQRLIGDVGCGTGEAFAVSAFEPPRIDAQAFMKRPPLSFVIAKRDLVAHKHNLDAAVRINTIRQYAFDALNWLFRSTTQPTGVHDVMWWFCTALEKHARFAPPPPSDDKETATQESTRPPPPVPSASALCPGGRAAQGSRASFHAFLGSISALAPNLPPTSAAALQAVRCWALNFTQHDRPFLHRSQVFSVISRILSQVEDGPFDDALLCALSESFQSYYNKESYAWTCNDVTRWCDVSVSSRQGMAGALTDGSTETFWESGDEDRNKAKWIQISYPGGTPDDRPHLICLHIDNTRDTVNKTLMVSFLYSGPSGEMYHMQDTEIDGKSAGWHVHSLPRVTCGPLRVRCELRGSEQAVRVRQIRVLSAPSPCPHPAHAPAGPARILHAITEADTLRVFRLLTSQVFGKLLDWDRSGEGAEGPIVVDATGGDADDSDLREHVVGILFAGHKLTSLQKQVMSHIVTAIGSEAMRVRDDWETAVLCGELPERATSDDEGSPSLAPPAQDNYCFEMLSLLLALSGSAAGRAHLAQRPELPADLLSLLHTGSERVQRQVISLLRRMIAEIPPQKMMVVINYGMDIEARVTLLDHLLSYIGKAISLQVKVKGTGATAPAGFVTMGSSVSPDPPTSWFMRGNTTKKHAQLIAKLITDMAEDKVSDAWGTETRTALQSYVVRLATIPEPSRAYSHCLAAPLTWLAIAALCVCESQELVNPNESESRSSRNERPFCVNHDDGVTAAVVECRACGALCAECDRFLHLKRTARTHQRQICKEEESAIRIDIHEGCGRAKLFWLLVLVDRRTLKGLAEFRGVDATDGNVPIGPHGLAGTCRFCGTRGNSGLLAIGNVCADHQCQEHGKESCTRVLPCGHLCGGVRGERTCLPCLFGCGGGDTTVPLRQDADDMCMICFTDPLQAAPAIQLQCGHVFHLHCCKKVLANKWNGPRITFAFSLCPICKEDMSHWTLEDILAPLRRLYAEVKRKALMRLEYEGVGPSGSRRAADPASYAMDRYAYYVCHKCGKAYFGGLARCEAETSGWWEPSELVCGACSDVAGARSCPKHGADFLEYKCRYCCSVAVFFCFGTSHFCNACHDDFQRVTNIPKNLLPHCPAGPKGTQLPGTSEECPLHIQHPPTGEEFALGCGICRPAHAF